MIPAEVDLLRQALARTGERRLIWLEGHEADCITRTEPLAEGGQFRLAGRITKDVDGVLQTHRFIRSDLFANPADAERFMVQKTHTFIDQMGERMFEPRVKPGDSSSS